MTLSKYNQKRNFEETAEPKGKIKKSAKELVFVVQKHAASHLHYDFRLEMEGVLKSWAVPKGPSMNPKDKRLAMMVEDHPYDYKDFEGNIPKGNYGAGNVIVWDNGTYNNPEAQQDPEKALRAGLHKGHLSFVLKGKKLKGEFSLIKLKGKQENAWLLIKKDDRYAIDTDILMKDKSVISKITLENMEKKISPEKEKAEKNPEIKNTPKKKAKVAFKKPMLADTDAAAFDREGWVFEIKYDGYRTVAVLNSPTVNLYSRNQLSFNTKFNTIADELKKIHHTAILDGEVVIEDEGKSDFQLLQNFQKTGIGTLKYYVFDILNLDGHNTTALTLIERKQLLKILLAKYTFDNIIYSDHIETKGKAFLDKAIQNNLEGIIAKDAQSPYRIGKRSNEWLKIKIIQNEEAIIIGYTEPKGSRKHFGSLLLGQYNDGELTYIGNCGTGFNDAVLKELFDQFNHLKIANAPISEKVKIAGKIHWLEPKLVCQIKFTEWTQDGHLRHPVYLGLRIDKKASEVNRGFNSNQKQSKPKKEAAMEKKKETTENDYDLKVGSVVLHLTNQNKIYFPKEGISKGDIIQYYDAVSQYILPYLKNRPQSMNRFPNGITGSSFYQKDIDLEKSPSWLKTEQIYSESNGKNIDYLICNDKATLLYMANLGCIELNPWNSTTKNIEKPDWVVIDIDPGKDEFEEVVRTALTVKEIMDEKGADCYCKTSGATGLHVYIPLNARYDYDTVKIFAELIAQEVHSRLPETTSLERSIKKRNTKIYIDYLQNKAGQTLASPYSVRPKDGATVSTPLDWSEVNEKLSPSQFTIKNVPQRIKEKGDLWKPVIGKGINIEKWIKSGTK